MMDDEIDDDALAAMMADDEEEPPPPPPVQSKLSFADQADRLSAAELVDLTCSLVDASTTKKKEPTVRASEKDIGKLLNSSSSTKNVLSAGPNSQSIINPSVYMDPTTHIRIGTMTLTPAELKLKLSSTKFIRLKDIDKQGSTMPTEWCTMAVLVNKSEAKQASNGSSYSIWKITDFQSTLNMFLFGDSHQNLWKTTVSSVILIYDADAKKPGQLSIKSQRNVCLLGVNPDLGQCKAKAKSGDQCKNFVDRHACEYCVTHAHQHYKKDQNNRNQHHPGNMSRMNLQSTGSFVPKKFAELGGMMMNPTSNIPMKKKPIPKDSKKSEGTGWNEKEKSMLVMLGIEDDPLICVRTPDTKGLGDSIADIREIYQAKQAAGKAKRITYDETKDRDDTAANHQIRSFPLAAPSSSPAPPPPVSQSKQFVDLNKSASTEAINNAKQRAIDILKQRLAQKQVKPSEGQSLVLAERGLKRSLPEVDSSPKRMKPTDNNERFAEIMNMKSAHADLYSQMTLDEIFERYKKKENIEEKLLQVMERDIKVVVCRLCHYTAYKQSVLCKQKQHYVKINEVKQKFFECVECHHRVFTWSQYPVENCVKCHSLKGFRRTALIRERKGAKFDDEILVLRGEERTFLNSFASYEKLPDVID